MYYLSALFIIMSIVSTSLIYIDRNKVYNVDTKGNIDICIDISD
jgi:hypothetical protein